MPPRLGYLKVQISTTPSLDGWEIEQYLGPVVAHTVAGTGFISDWLASFSDFFGGRSGAYRNQLRSLSDESLLALRMRANELDANWVVGLTIDMDQVSGQGKQMFMVTAMGTAVRAQRISATGRGEPPASRVGARDGASPVAADAPLDSGRISQEAVQAAARRYALLEALEAKKLVFDDDTWTTLMEERVAEAAPSVVRTLGKLLAAGSEGQLASFRPRAVRYLEHLPAGDVTMTLYAALEGDARAADAAVALIKELQLRDLTAIRRLLSSSEPEPRRRAIQVLTAEQRGYGPEDLEHLEAIAAMCADTTVFPPYAEVLPPSGSGFFASKERLRCSCGTERPASEVYCTNMDCQRDRLGFRHGQVTPPMAKEFCEELAKTLRRVFGEMSEPGATRE